jgi:hypothetical protein
VKVGDLVRRKDTIDPRVGIINEARLLKDELTPDMNGRTLTRVTWNTGQYGHYFADYLEVVSEGKQDVHK